MNKYRVYKQVKSRANGETYTRVPFVDFVATLHALKRYISLSELTFNLPMELIFDNGRICNEWDSIEIESGNLIAVSSKHGSLYYRVDAGCYVLDHSDDIASLGELKEVFIYHEDFQAIVDLLV